MGAVKRDREREGKGEKADMYCGCLMTAKGKKKRESSKREKCGGALTE